MEDHGGINRFGFTWTIVVLAIFHCIFAIMKKIYQFRKSLFVIVLLLVALFMLAFYFLRINNSWDGWINGLKNHQLINDGKHWHVPIPTFWELGIRNNWFDFNKFTKQWNNLAQTFDRSILTEKLRNKDGLTLLGFPRTEWSPFHILVNQTLYRKEVRLGIIDMNDPEVPQSIKDNVEFTLNISDPKNAILYVRNSFNISRADEQKKLREQIIQNEKNNGTYKTRLDK